MPEKKKRRPLLRALIVIVLLIVVLVAAAPTLLSFGPAASLARQAIAKSVNGDVAIGSVRLGWLGAQRVEGLSIRDSSGANAIDLDLTLNHGLLGLIASGGNEITATVSGSVKGTIEPSGGSGLARLFDTETSRASSDASSSKPGAESRPLHATLNVERFSFELIEVAGGRRYGLTDAHGSASLDGAAGVFSASLESGTDLIGGKGSLSLAATVKNLAGAFDPAGIGVDLAVDGKNIRVPVEDRTADFTTVHVALKCDRLGDALTLAADAEGSLDGTTPSSLKADLAVERPIRAGGAVAAPGELLAGLKGSVVAARLPTSLAQPMLAATAVRLHEDLGPTIDTLEVKAPGGGSAPITLSLTSRKATLKAEAIVGMDGSIRDADLDATIDASPETVARLANATIGGDARLSVAGRDISWSPPPGGQGALSSFSGDVSAETRAPVSWTEPSGRFSLALGGGSRIGIARPSTGDPFAASASVAIGVGGATGATAPSAPNLEASARISGALDRVSDTKATLDIGLEPAFLESIAHQSFPKPLPLHVEITTLDAALPPKGADGLAINALVRVDGENAVYVKELSRDLRFGDLRLTVISPDAAKGAEMTLVGSVDRGSIEVRQTMGPLPADFAAIEPLAIDTRGSIRLSGIDGAALVPWMPERRDVIEAAKIEHLSLDLRNEPLASRKGQRVTATLSGKPLSGDVVVDVESTAARVETLSLAGVVGKDLVAALQSTQESKVRLAEDVAFTLGIERPVAFTFDELRAGGLPKGLAARLASPQVVVSAAPGLASGLALRELDATVAVEPSGKAATAKGSFMAAGTTSATDRIERAAFDLGWAERAGPSMLRGVTGTVSVRGISMPWIETLVGKEQGSLSTWTGDAGDLSITMASTASGETVRLMPTFPRVEGSLDVTAEGSSIEARTNGLAVRVDPEALTRLAAQPGSEQAKQTRHSFATPLVAQLTSGVVRVPQALREGGYSLAGTTVDVAVETQPLSIRVESPGQPVGTIEMPGLLAKANAADLSTALAFSVAERGPVSGGAAAPSIKVTGNARSLLGAAGTLAGSRPVLDLDAEVKELPSVFVDVLAATGGTVTRSLGDKMSVTAKASSLSAAGGSLSARLTAPYAEVDVPSIAIKDDTAVIGPDRPITASFELSPGIKNQILYVINPVFADIDVAAKRATFTMPALAYPLDGTMSRLNGSFRLDIGDIKFKNGAPLSAVMMLFRDKPENLEGRIEPLAVTMTNGVLTYKEFGLRFGRTQAGWKTRSDMEGSIDRTKRPIYVNAITTSLPVSQAGNFSSDVRGFFDKIGGPDSDIAKTLSIGVTMFGPLYDAAGKRAPLQVKAALPKIEDLLKDPGNLLKEGLKIFEGIQKEKSGK